MTRGGEGPADDVAEGGERIAVPLMTLGSGELPGGMSWTLEARRDGGVCTTLNVTPAPPTRERCLRTRSYRPIGNMTTRIFRNPAGRVYLSVGQVTERAERVRVAPDGVPAYEVPALGGGTGLDVRFFVMHITENVAVTITALGADGAELGRLDRPPLPTN